MVAESNSSADYVGPGTGIRPTHTCALVPADGTGHEDQVRTEHLFDKRKGDGGGFIHHQHLRLGEERRVLTRAGENAGRVSWGGRVADLITVSKSGVVGSMWRWGHGVSAGEGAWAMERGEDEAPIGGMDV